MPTPITRLRVRPLIGQTEMFPPVTKSHHPSVKHTQSSAYRFTHYSYILTCRSQTVLQRSNANMGAGVPLRERHDSPPRPIPGIIMPLHFSGHQIVKTQRNKERRSCLVDKLQQREIRCFRCVEKADGEASWNNQVDPKAHILSTYWVRKWKSTWERLKLIDVGLPDLSLLMWHYPGQEREAGGSAWSQQAAGKKS